MAGEVERRRQGDELRAGARRTGKIVDDLERGDVPLDQSIRIYERGEALKAHCDRLLKAAEDKVEKIRLSRDGKPVGGAAGRGMSRHEGGAGFEDQADD